MNLTETSVWVNADSPEILLQAGKGRFRRILWPEHNIWLIVLVFVEIAEIFQKLVVFPFLRGQVGKLERFWKLVYNIAK